MKKSMKKISLLFTLSLAALCATGCELSDANSILEKFGIVIETNNSEKEPETELPIIDLNNLNNQGLGGKDDNKDDQTDHGNNNDNDNKDDDKDDNKDDDNTQGEGYYVSINSGSSTLLDDLRKLNLSKRKSTVGYSAMGTSTNGQFKYTDYDPATVKYDGNGQPYGTKILSFYSGKSVTSWNREHVWPNSRGGGSVESDVFMPRPTITAENSNRGNSSYVEGMSHCSNGWDPITAFGESNCYQGIRGECARIIFYCLTVNSNLSIKDDADTSYKNSIGKLSDLLKWNLEYPVNDREKRRNDGGEYLQGNRNAFVDHPEYVCKIWGKTNSETKRICGMN